MDQDPRAADSSGAARARRRFTADVWDVIREYRWRVGISIAMLLVAKVTTVAVPLVLKRIIDVFSLPSLPTHLPWYLLIGYALLRFSSTLFNEWRDLLFARVTQSTVSSYARKTFAHLHALGPRFHARRQVGSLPPDIDRGSAGIAYLLGVGLFTIVPTLVEIGRVLVVMLRRYQPEFSGIIGVTFLAYTGFTLVFTARRVIYQRRVNKLDSRAKGQLADSLINHGTVKYFTNEAFEAARFSGIMERWRDAGIQNQRALFILHVGQSAVIAVGVAAIMLRAGYGVMAHRMSVGDLVLINAYVLQVCLPLNALGFVYRESRDAWVNAERLFALPDEAPEMPQPPQPPLHASAGEVVFDHVSFEYEPGRAVLHDLSLRIAPGTTLAVVGRSGSGKSTLARLLLRLYDPSSGRILIDGQDIRAWDASSVRRAIAALPEGYGAPVGERGVKFSGGERQRIGIARAILMNPCILIFDEATSALDADAEHAIVQELERLARARTTLIIAHRLFTIVNAHTIIVMERGRIAECGKHAELLAANGLYARLWRLQQRRARAQERGADA